MRRTGFFLLFVFLIASLWGQGARESVIEIRVAQGDTLAKICRTYLLDPGEWRQIAELNRLANPNLIEPGQVLIIPVRLLKAAPGTGSASFLRGKAEVKQPGSEVWSLLAKGDVVSSGSFVRTLESSVVEITFESGDTCLLRPGTTLGISTLERRGESWIRQLELSIGKVITRIQKATGAQSRFEIRTPSAQCAARGTLFRASVDEMATTRSEVLEGAISVEAQRARVDVQTEEGTAVRKNERPLPPRRLLPPPRPAKLEPLYKIAPVDIPMSPPDGAVALIVALTRDPSGMDVVRESVLKPGEHFKTEIAEDGLYYLQGLSIDDLGLEGIPALPVEIHVRTRPHPPQFLSPAPGAGYRTEAPAFQWRPEAEAERYRIQLAPRPGFEAITREATISAATWSSAPLLKGGYWIRIQSIAADGYESAWSPAVNFAVLPPLPAPSLEKPELESRGIRFRWNDLGEPLMYRLQVSPSESFESLLHDELVAAPPGFMPTPTKSGVYYARVKAIEAGGAESGFSSPAKFRVGGFWASICKPCFLAPLALLIYLLSR